MTTCHSSIAADPWATFPVRIDEIIPECDGVATYRLTELSRPAGSTYRFQPGQFNMLYVPGVGESAISMSGDSERPDAWIHTIRVAGNVTRTISRLQVGETLGLRGPFGAGWPIETLQGSDVVVVGGGLGLAPLRPLIYFLANHRAQFGRVTLILGARTPDGLLYQNEYEAWKARGIEVQLTVDRGGGDWRGHIGVVTTLLDRMQLPDCQQTHILTCGPEVMMKYAALSAIRRGVASQNIWISMERNMQCAVGICGHCQLGPAFICKDGPVMAYHRLQPYLFVESL